MCSLRDVEGPGAIVVEPRERARVDAVAIGFGGGIFRWPAVGVGALARAYPRRGERRRDIFQSAKQHWRPPGRAGVGDGPDFESQLRPLGCLPEVSGHASYFRARPPRMVGKGAQPFGVIWCDFGARAFVYKKCQMFVDRRSSLLGGVLRL